MGVKVVDATVMCAAQRETEQVERRRHSATAHTLPIGEQLLDVQVVALELFGEHQTETCAVQPNWPTSTKGPPTRLPGRTPSPTESVVHGWYIRAVASLR